MLPEISKIVEFSKYELFKRKFLKSWEELKWTPSQSISKLSKFFPLPFLLFSSHNVCVINVTICWFSGIFPRKFQLPPFLFWLIFIVNKRADRWLKQFLECVKEREGRNFYRINRLTSVLLLTTKFLITLSKYWAYPLGYRLATLTMLWRNSWSITWLTHEKLASICQLEVHAAFAQAMHVNQVPYLSLAVPNVVQQS